MNRGGKRNREKERRREEEEEKKINSGEEEGEAERRIANKNLQCLSSSVTSVRTKWNWRLDRGACPRNGIEDICRQN